MPHLPLKKSRESFGMMEQIFLDYSVCHPLTPELNWQMMSIYATLSEFGIKRFEDREFVRILGQGAPPHIDYVGPQWDFLPPPVDPNGSVIRAVFFVEAGDEKGTPRCGQEYVRPLLMLSGKEYEQIRFADLMSQLETALDMKYGKRPATIYLDPDGTEKKLY
jgi:hypothetical protein